MNKLVCSLLVMGCMSATLPSCKLFRHKTSKKKKEATAQQAKVLDSAAAAIRNVAVVDSGNGNMKALIDSTASVWQQKSTLRTFSTKAKMHYESGDKNYDFVANIRLRQDSLIWVSVTVAGIVQVARAVITPDSFKAILYTEKQAFERPVSKVNSILPEGLDFFALQNVLLGNAILAGKGQVTRVADTGSQWFILRRDQNYLEQMTYNKADSTLQADQLITTDGPSRSLTHILSAFERIGGMRIPNNRKLTVVSDSSSMVVDIEYSNVLIDNELTYPFSIPKNYTIR